MSFTKQGRSSETFAKQARSSTPGRFGFGIFGTARFGKADDFYTEQPRPAEAFTKQGRPS